MDAEKALVELGSMMHLLLCRREHSTGFGIQSEGICLFDSEDMENPDTQMWTKAATTFLSLTSVVGKDALRVLKELSDIYGKLALFNASHPDVYQLFVKDILFKFEP